TATKPRRFRVRPACLPCPALRCFASLIDPPTSPPRTFMTSLRPRFLSLLTLALGAALCAPAQAQSLLELLESARTFDTPWQSARAQLEAAARRADQARAGLLPSAGLPAGLNRANVELSRPRIENTGT